MMTKIHLKTLNLDFVQFCDGISERIAGPFFLFLLINSAFGYEFRKKRKKLQSAASGSARQKLYKVELEIEGSARCQPLQGDGARVDPRFFRIGGGAASRTEDLLEVQPGH